MIEGLYDLLDAIGYSHPLHPLFVHIPMGMVIGAVLFSLVDLKWKNLNLAQTAFHCIVLALIFVVPTLIAGILDWQALLGGEWEFLIIVKLTLAVILTILLVVAVILKRKGTDQKTLMIIYLICMACAVGLGYFGGELVYG